MSFEKYYKQIIFPTFEKVLQEHKAKDPQHHEGIIDSMGSVFRLFLRRVGDGLNWTCELWITDYGDEDGLLTLAGSCAFANDTPIIKMEDCSKSMSADALSARYIEELMRYLISALSKEQRLRGLL